MPRRYTLDQPESTRCQEHIHSASILEAATLANQTRSDATHDERGGPMWTRLKALRELPDTRPVTIGKTPDVEQQQVLSRGYASRARGMLAEA